MTRPSICRLLALALMTAPTPSENPTQPFSALVEPQWRKTAQPTASAAGTGRHEEAGSAMSKVMPELVNQLTPDGKLPEQEGDILSKGLDMLRGHGA